MTIIDLSTGQVKTSIHTCDTADPENVVRLAYEKAPTYVIQSSISFTEEDLLDYFNAIEERVVEDLKRRTDRSIAEIFVPGVPDFFVVDRKTLNFFFVEVKRAGDGLRDTQLKWVRDLGNRVPVKIAYVEPE